MKTFSRTLSFGSVVVALLGFAVSTAEANVYTNKLVVVEGYWNGAYEDFYSTPSTLPTREGEIGYGSLMQQPVVNYEPYTQVRILDQYDPIVFKVVLATNLQETFKMNLQGKTSRNEWVAVNPGGDFLEWRVTTNAPVFLSNFDFSYIRTTTTEQYRLDPVPEPTAVAILGLGLAAFVCYRRR